MTHYIVQFVVLLILSYIVVDWIRGLTWRDKLHLNAPCPFHRGKAATLNLNLITGRYYCIECGKKGWAEEALKGIQDAQKDGSYPTNFGSSADD